MNNFGVEFLENFILLFMIGWIHYVFYDDDTEFMEILKYIVIYSMAFTVISIAFSYGELK